MRKKVYKYQLELKSHQVIEMPKGSQILTFQEQNGILTLWAIVDTEEFKTEEREISIYATGYTIPDKCDVSNWIGTVQVGSLVWHVFEN